MVAHMKRVVASTMFPLALCLAAAGVSCNDDQDQGSNSDSDDDNDDDDDDPGAANVTACEEFLDEVSCGDFDFNTVVDCSIYKQTTCDISDYFDCLSDELTCTDGVADTSGWASCVDEAECD